MVDGNAWSAFGDVAARLPAGVGAVELSELPTPTTVLLQGDPADNAWLAAAGAVAGVALGVDIGQAADAGERRAYRLGPDMWLLTCDGPSPADELAALAGRHPQSGAVETTEARVWLKLEGAGAAGVLAKLATLDFRNAAFPVGKAVGAHIGPLSCLIERRGAEAFIVAGPTSSAEYLAELLVDAMAGV